MKDQDKSKEQLIEELTELRRNLDALMNNLPEGVFIVDAPDVRIRSASQDACQMIGVSRGEIEGTQGEEHFRYYQAFLPNGEQAKVEQLPLARVLMGGEVIRNEEWLFQLRDGRRFPALCHAGPVRDQHGTITGGVISWQNITDRKRAEEGLQQAHDELERRVEERTAELRKANEQLQIFQQFAEASGQGFSMADLGGHLLYMNPALCRMLGIDRPEEYVGHHFSACYCEADNRKGREEIEPFLRQHGRWEGELPLLSRQGKSIPTWHHAFLIRDESGTPFRLAVVITDITERKRAQEALERERRTLEHMLRASDHERQLIAYDIHDGLAQQLAGAIMQFQVHDHLRKTQPDKAQQAYDGGMILLRQGHAEARRLISGVRPPILDEAGVMAAILHLVNERGVDQEPKIEVHGKVTFTRLAPILESAIYRIVQEGLTNACKHSQSERVRISLLQRNGHLRIEIRDWGIGFDPKAARDSRYGLEGMRERARLLGGRFRIRSKANEGTSVVVEVPIVVRKAEE